MRVYAENCKLTTLVWFRNDLRVQDNPALEIACEAGPVTACFVCSETQWRRHDVGDRRIAFLGRCLNSLAIELGKLGISLKVVNAPGFEDVPDAIVALALQSGAHRVVMNAEYPANEKRRDNAVCQALSQRHIEVVVTHGSVTLQPGLVLKGDGNPYSVFGAFRRRWCEIVQPDQVQPLPRLKPQAASITPVPIVSLGGVALDLLSSGWVADEKTAGALLDDFVGSTIVNYSVDRDIPSLEATSRLGACLSVGVLSSNQCFAAVLDESGRVFRGGKAASWTDQLIWREFYRHVVALFPHVSRNHSFRRAYDGLQWRRAQCELELWQKGETGFPLVDAGMRQLLETGWMHNRLRMVVAMFLTKHLLIDWRHGERFFMQQLVDGDFAANNAGWQWSASTGTDAAPYFRIFNPTTQGKRFDPNGKFVRQMIPVLSEVPDQYIFEPHKAGLSIAYPQPMVDHKQARERAIGAFKALKLTQRKIV